MTFRLLASVLAVAACLPAEVTVRADFPGGSIGEVERVAPAHLRCSVKGETDQDKRNRQASWYYFRVDGARGREIIIDLVDLAGEYDYRPGNISINGKTRPFISYDRLEWTPLPDSAVEWDAEAVRLRLRFKPVADPVWVAHVPPYTGENLAKLIAAGKQARNFQVSKIGKSAMGRSLLQFTLTDRTAPDSDKKVLWLMARQHAWESGTSWMMEGAVRFLLSKDPAAARILNEYVFHFFPMADPDGVERGGVRFNTHGYDVNRNWDIDLPKRMPEIDALRRAVFQWVDGGRRVDLFIALHNTNSDYIAGPLTAAEGRHRTMIDGIRDRLAKKTSFEPEKTRDFAATVERGRMGAPQALFAGRKVPALLMESNVNFNGRLGRVRGTKDWIQLGSDLAAIMAEVVERGSSPGPN